jgi:hypothetical protein
MKAISRNGLFSSEIYNRITKKREETARNCLLPHNRHKLKELTR